MVYYVLNLLSLGNNETHTKRDYKCFYCHKPLKEKQVTKDHIIAKSLGGTSHGKNLVDSCKMCNLFKSNMTLDNFKIKLELILTNVNKITNERRTKESV